MVKTKKKDVWKIPGILYRMQSLVSEGVLDEDTGTDGVYNSIRKEFSAELAGCAFNKRKFDTKLNELIWTTGVTQELKKAVRHRLDPETIYSAMSHIPYKMFLKKWNSLKGRAAKQRSAEFVRGILRISDNLGEMSGEVLDFQTGTFKHPHEITERLPGMGESQLFYLNGVNLGVLYSPVFEENPALQALQNAEANHDDAVILTNFLEIDTKKAAGPLKVYRALFSDRHVNVDVMDPRYAREAKRILETKPHEEMVYEILAEAFLNGMKGWAKIVGSKKKPTFDGPVCVVLGYKEEELIATAAYWEAAYFTRRKQEQLQIQMALVRTEIRKALKEDEDADVSKLEALIEDYRDQLSRTRVTNIAPEDLKRYYYKVMRFVIKTVEATIPNSKVIGLGTTYVKIGNKLIEINIPRDEKPSDEVLSNYVRSYGPRVLRERMGDAVVICHPFAINHRFTVREVDRDGKRFSAPVFVAPILVDEIFIRNVLRDTVRKAHPIARTMLNEQFNAGVLRLKMVNGVFLPEPWGFGALQSFAKSYNKKPKSRKFVPETKYIWVAFFTDPHIGSASREILTAPDGRLYGVTEAVMEMMRKGKLMSGNNFPVHMFSMNDDPTQGNHFGTHQQPSPNKMSLVEIERSFHKAIEEAGKTDDPSEVRRILGKVAKLSRLQFWYRGEHWVNDQVQEVIDRLVEPNVDFFDAILRRAKKSGLVVRGMSYYSKEDKDSRDIGVVNIGTGNHFLHSVENQLTEGGIYAACLRNRLLSFPRWKNAEEELRRSVKAPLYSNQNIAWGTIQAPGGYEWGIDFRDTPTGGIDWNDTLQGVVRSDLKRGNYNRIMEGRVTLKAYGDKHFFGLVLTPWAIYHMSAADTHTDLYGERGFPPNNTGMSFIGLPVGGPKSGPVLCRFLPFDHIRRFFEDGEVFDWDAFLPNPL